MTADHAPFAQLFPEADALRCGAYHGLRAYTGVLREEQGAAYAVRPTTYAAPPGGDHRDATGYLTREPTRRLHALAGGVVRGAEGAVVDPASGLAVRETLETWDEPVETHPALRAGEWAAPERVPGVSLLLGTLGGDGFYHFLLEALPRLLFARDLLPACDTVLVAGAGEPWRVAWLERAGVDPARVRWLGPASHLVCEQLVFAGPVVRHFEPNPWAVAALRDLAPPGTVPSGTVPPATVPPGETGRELWLDRSGTANRHKPWEADLRRLVAPGAEPVDLGALTPGEVARTCAGASTIAGLHGAAFANMLFARPGTRVLELQPEPVAPWFARLADVCGHRHLAVPVDPDDLPRAAALSRTLRADV